MIQKSLLSQILLVLGKHTVFNDIFDECLKKLVLFHQNFHKDSVSLFYSYEVLCHWTTHVPDSVLNYLLDFGWENMGNESVECGFYELIRYADKDRSRSIFESIWKHTNSIIRSLKMNNKEAVPTEYVLKSLKTFFIANAAEGNNISRAEKK